MAGYKKFKIKGLTNQVKLTRAGKIVLNYRLNILYKSIKNYLKEETIEKLHSVRIALRRVRYNMEIFAVCFDKKKFMVFYKLIEELQDLSGSVRDLDVMNQNINSLVTENNLEVPDKILESINSKRINLITDLKIKLENFIKCDELKEFKKIVKLK